MVDNRTFLSSKGIIQQAPLYLCPDTDKRELFNHKKESDGRKPNINHELFVALTEAYKKELTPEEIFHYIYAVLYSNIYRTKYAEFLKIDFPRVPFTKDYKVFSKMAEYGKKLVDLHLLRSQELDPPVAKFQGKGEDKVEKVRYEPAGAGHNLPRVYINKDQFFEGVSQEVWEYQIGGYQVCDKWLKDRKGRKLSLDDIKHYCSVVTVLKKTIETQKAIDVVYLDVEKETIEFEKEL
jgi:predicted helicase